MVSGGDRRSPGRSREVAALVIAQPDRIEELVALLDDESPFMKMRAADACEQISFECPDMLQGEVPDFLDIAAQEQPQDVCWRLCLILPRLRLTNEQRKTAFESFAGYT